MLLSNSEISSLLGRGGVALEYTNDSPMFRQQLLALEDTYTGFPSYCKQLSAALDEYNRVAILFANANDRLAECILGNNYSRSLFTNSLPSLGDLNELLRSTADLFIKVSSNNEKMVNNIKQNVMAIINELAKGDELLDIRKMKKELDGKYNDYEIELDYALSKKKKKKAASSTSVDRKDSKIIQIRSNYELHRFDLVTKMNSLDFHKKLNLTHVMLNLQSYHVDNHAAVDQLVELNKAMYEKRKEELPNAIDIIERNMNLYSGLRTRLQGELVGQLAPPGSPPGAVSPVQSRIRHGTHLGMPLYSIALTTEIRTPGTRSATYEDVRHALTDDGIYKQGYLFSRGGLLSGYKRYRKWYRLYGSKLYTMEMVVNNSLGPPSCTMEIVCDVQDAAVCAKQDDIPYKFIITVKGGTSKFELQAESEDEMVKWISAIRRCSIGIMNKRRPSNISSKGMTPDVSSCVVVQYNETSDLVIAFVTKNNYCAECNSLDVTWISISIGITLCEECASVHRQLTWSISKLKNIRLDEFSKWQMNLLICDLGNVKSNSIWEKNIPEGWMKPTQQSPAEDKAQFILAKYLWFGFVDEYYPKNELELVVGMMESIANDDVKGVLWWVSHNASVNADYPVGSGRTPLHEAVEKGHITLTALLVLNGADLYSEDCNGDTPLDIANKSDNEPLIDMLRQILEGLI